MKLMNDKQHIYAAVSPENLASGQPETIAPDGDWFLVPVQSSNLNFKFRISDVEFQPSISKSYISDLKSQVSNPKSQIPNPRSPIGRGARTRDSSLSHGTIIRMNNAGKINRIVPKRAIPGGEISIECEGFRTGTESAPAAVLEGEHCRIIAASSRRVLAALPTAGVDGKSSLHLESGGVETVPARINVGRLLAADMHIVANPAIDPKDDSLIFTRSGSRGQQLSSTLFRLETDGYLDELPVDIMNPTGIAFDVDGEMFVTNRAEGQVCRIERGEEAVVYATGLGIATGIAFDNSGVMYIGDRSGTIYRIEEPGLSSPFATLEASVAAYHMAFGPDGRLFVTAPGLASHDAVHAIDADGKADTYFRGLGRPQGLAFDTDGNLYVAACYAGRHGIVRIGDGGESAELFVAGNNVVGLCFTRSGEMVVATNDSVFSLNVGIYGTLLQ